MPVFLAVLMSLRCRMYSFLSMSPFVCSNFFPPDVWPAAETWVLRTSHDLAKFGGCMAGSGLFLCALLTFKLFEKWDT